MFHPEPTSPESYFFQDNWKLTPTLALTLGLRYENFGQPANSLPYPAFSGFDPAQFLVRHEVHRDNKDFGPAFGLAWSPIGALGLAGKTVRRRENGLARRIPDQLRRLLHADDTPRPATATPNAISTNTTAPNTGRGPPNWFEQLPTAAAAPSLTDAQIAIDPNLRSPYTERWSFGFQRQLPQSMLLDVSYVGSESHKLTTKPI